MITKHFSMVTLIVYLTISFISGIIFKYAKKNENKKISYFLYFIEVVLLTIFAAFRYIDIDPENQIGGADLTNYLKSFENAKFIPLNLYQTIRLDDYEFIFYNFLYVIRLITDNYRILFVIIYGLISFSYVYYMKRNLNKKEWWIYSLIIILPILKSFNLIRNILAVGVILVALERLKKRNIFGYFALVTVAFLIHYSAFIMYFFGIYYIFLYRWHSKSKKRYLTMNVLWLLILSIMIPVLKIIALDTGYNGYVNRDISFLGYVPIIIETIIVFVFFKDIKKEVDKNNANIHLAVFSFTILTLPAFIFVGGANRFDMFLEMPRIVLWAYIVETLIKKSKSVKIGNIITSFMRDEKLVKFCVTLIIIAFIIFKITRIWSSYSIMPYYNILFQIGV